MREHTRAPARLTFFLFIYFHTEVRKAIRSMNLLSTFVFLFVSMCIVYVYAFLSVWLLQLLFIYCSVASSSLPSFGSPIFPFYLIIIRSLTFCLLDHSTPVLPLAFPVFFHFW